MNDGISIRTGTNEYEGIIVFLEYEGNRQNTG